MGALTQITPMTHSAASWVTHSNWRRNTRCCCYCFLSYL